MMLGPAALRLPLLLALELVACTHYVSRGSDLYFQGRYIEAAQVLEQTEARLDEAAPYERAEYGLYRGATLLRLGDLDGALHWLEYAREWQSKAPGSLRADEQDLLDERFIAVHGDLERGAAAGGAALESRVR
jgi:tetratricopeptide (TPR) repeat protein